MGGCMWLNVSLNVEYVSVYLSGPLRFFAKYLKNRQANLQETLRLLRQIYI